jgi:hypothetical protein
MVEYLEENAVKPFATMNGRLWRGSATGQRLAAVRYSGVELELLVGAASFHLEEEEEEEEA